MELKKISEKGNTLKLLVKDVDAAFMNAVRRTVINHVPTLAVEDLKIYENSSALFDEFLGSRLGLVPLKTDVEKFDPKYKVKFVLDMEGPCTVYSKDIKSTDGRADVVDKKIPIVKLKGGQKVKVEMDATAGTGKEHSKWQPAVIAYQELPVFSVSNECNLCKKCVESCAKGLLAVKSRKIVLTDPIECDLCAKCRDSCKKNAIKLGYNEGAFILNMETHGGLANKRILLEAARVLKEKTTEFNDLIKKI